MQRGGYRDGGKHWDLNGWYSLLGREIREDSGGGDLCHTASLVEMRYNTERGKSVFLAGKLVALWRQEIGWMKWKVSE